jgi:hypothetical protein
VLRSSDAIAAEPEEVIDLITWSTTPLGLRCANAPGSRPPSLYWCSAPLGLGNSMIQILAFDIRVIAQSLEQLVHVSITRILENIRLKRLARLSPHPYRQAPGRRARDQSDHFAPPSFDDLVGAGEDRLRHSEAEGLGGLQIDHQLERGRLLYGQIGRLLALQDLFRRKRRPGD